MVWPHFGEQKLFRCSTWFVLDRPGMLGSGAAWSGTVGRGGLWHGLLFGKVKAQHSVSP